MRPPQVDASAYWVLWVDDHEPGQPDMTDFIAWALTVEALGFVALPVTFVLFSRLPYGGYAFSKPLGILLFGFLVWVVGLTEVVPLNRAVVSVLAVVLLTTSLLAVRSRTPEFLEYLKRQRWTIAIVDMLFVLALVCWVVVRAYNPSISHTEQPMDFALINSVVRAESMPPLDPWLSGHSVSYYYFGYVMHGMLAKVSGVEPTVAYNLAIALLFSLAFTGAFGLVAEMVAMHRKGHGSRDTVPIGVGLLGALLMMWVGNLQGVAESVRSLGLGGNGVWEWVGVEGATNIPESSSFFPTEFWWWWRSTRVIDAADSFPAITEFPSFSFILGDLHPHLMSLPFVILALALSFTALASSDFFGVQWIKKNKVAFAVVSLSLGGLGFLNSWDLPLALALFLGTTFISSRRSVETWGREQTKNWLIFAGSLVTASIAFYLPFYLGDRPSPLFPWVLPVKDIHTRYIDYFLVLGLFLMITVPFILALALRRRSDRTGLGVWWWGGLTLGTPLAVWAVIVFLAGAVQGEAVESLAEIGSRFLWTLPLLMLIALAFWLMLRLGFIAASEATIPVVFAVILVFSGLFVTLGPELFRIVDVFGNRMNTVFKFYYQTWILLAVASTFVIYYLFVSWDWSRPVARVAGATSAGLIALLIVASSMYSFGAINDKTDSFSGSPTLDGLAFIGAPESPERRALEFLSRDARPYSVLVEAVAVDDRGVPGGDYRLDYARISGRTGVPTVLGWAGHEEQWRGNRVGFRERADDVKAIYTDPDPTIVRDLLGKYGIEYVYVGALERDLYALPEPLTFDSFMDRAFESGDITIYKMREN